MIQNVVITLDEEGLNRYSAAMEAFNNAEIIAIYNSVSLKKRGIYLLRDTEVIAELKQAVQDRDEKILELTALKIKAENEAASFKYQLEQAGIEVKADVNPTSCKKRWW